MLSEQVAWNGCKAPQKITLDGQYVLLEPLTTTHAQHLFEASKAGLSDERFQYLPDLAPNNMQEFQNWIDQAISNDSLIFFAAIDKSTNRTEGRCALMRMDLNNGVIEIGHVLWGDAIKRSRITTEAFYLLAEYVFSLGFRRLEWKCNNLNEPSKKAALRFGFQYEGLFRQHMIVKGQNRDTAWFSIIDKEWPILRQKYIAWLKPENFDENGQQKQSLKHF
ncbi:GNAT family N-acetyltransferase [Bartonella sp. HY329]|uniref:GNAT family N-acetyltransferase n=1 Tax=unclassified Bartonella TaxID=2645622 RepID=UPI0021C8BABA|nr:MULTISPECIES: GNAT family protein [unclassified Bartonella]UXM94656.1 GNAT family N-acetyltransferase [Bartonella sp. HY329]UXN08979.1 GNAT family N-acetyltransferase [Bartonella sp. HY328]